MTSVPHGKTWSVDTGDFFISFSAAVHVATFGARIAGRKTPWRHHSTYHGIGSPKLRAPVCVQAVILIPTPRPMEAPDSVAPIGRTLDAAR